ncbi:hypothetical protein [Clostridium butyricum]|uniref:hypothetical protein n=1 Tax=Clostridium butyricum TaxID=1492 RepID=UPI00325A878F
MKKRYFVLDSKTFAEAMNLLGFSFYVFQKDDNKKVYSFENTELFQEAYTKICELRKEYRNKLNK